MPCNSQDFNILLVDDEVEELHIVQRIVDALSSSYICVDHVTKCSEAVQLLSGHDYDLVLLDNILSGQISAEFSAPFIQSTRTQAILTIISKNINVPYLHDPTRIKVDHIVDKIHIIPFLRAQLQSHGLSSGSQPSAAE